MLNFFLGATYELCPFLQCLVQCIYLFLTLLQQNQSKQMEANAQKTIERRSLVPRMIYLSMQSASSSVKDNIEANGSLSDPKVSLELKILLERYTKILGFPFDNAVELVSGVSSGLKSSEVSFYNHLE